MSADRRLAIVDVLSSDQGVSRADRRRRDAGRGGDSRRCHDRGHLDPDRPGVCDELVVLAVVVLGLALLARFGGPASEPDAAPALAMIVAGAGGP